MCQEPTSRRPREVLDQDPISVGGRLPYQATGVEPGRLSRKTLTEKRESMPVSRLRLARRAVLAVTAIVDHPALGQGGQVAIRVSRSKASQAVLPALASD